MRKVMRGIFAACAVLAVTLVPYWGPAATAEAGVHINGKPLGEVQDILKETARLEILN